MPRYQPVPELCTSCQEGKYVETSLMDDFAGVLHCNKCGHMFITNQLENPPEATIYQKEPMEKYKTEHFDPITFQSKGVKDMEIPKMLVDAIQSALNNLPLNEDGKEPWVITPVMTNPNLKEITFGLLSNTPPTHFEYVVSIKTKEYWDNLYERLKELKQIKNEPGKSE